MKKCRGCLGLEFKVKSEEGKCPLGYRYDGEKPLESCPRPKTFNKLGMVLEENGIELPMPENVVYIPAKKKEDQVGEADQKKEK